MCGGRGPIRERGPCDGLAASVRAWRARVAAATPPLAPPMASASGERHNNTPHFCLRPEGAALCGRLRGSDASSARSCGCCAQRTRATSGSIRMILRSGLTETCAADQGRGSTEADAAVSQRCRPERVSASWRLGRRRTRLHRPPRRLVEAGLSPRGRPQLPDPRPHSVQALQLRLRPTRPQAPRPPCARRAIPRVAGRQHRRLLPPPRLSHAPTPAAAPRSGRCAARPRRGHRGKRRAA